MEVIAGALHTLFPMGDATRVGEARRHAALLAADIGLDEQAAGRLALTSAEVQRSRESVPAAMLAPVPSLAAVVTIDTSGLLCAVFELLVRRQATHRAPPAGSNRQ